MPRAGIASDTSAAPTNSASLSQQAQATGSDNSPRRSTSIIGRIKHGVSDPFKRLDAAVARIRKQIQPTPYVNYVDTELTFERGGDAAHGRRVLEREQLWQNEWAHIDNYEREDPRVHPSTFVLQNPDDTYTRQRLMPDWPEEDPRGTRPGSSGSNTTTTSTGPVKKTSLQDYLARQKQKKGAAPSPAASSSQEVKSKLTSFDRPAKRSFEHVELAESQSELDSEPAFKRQKTPSPKPVSSAQRRRSKSPKKQNPKATKQEGSNTNGHAEAESLWSARLDQVPDGLPPPMGPLVHETAQFEAPSPTALQRRALDTVLGGKSSIEITMSMPAILNGKNELGKSDEHEEITKVPFKRQTPARRASETNRVEKPKSKVVRLKLSSSKLEALARSLAKKERDQSTILKRPSRPDDTVERHAEANVKRNGLSSSHTDMKTTISSTNKTARLGDHEDGRQEGKATEVVRKATNVNDASKADTQTSSASSKPDGPRDSGKRPLGGQTAAKESPSTAKRTAVNESPQDARRRKGLLTVDQDSPQKSTRVANGEAKSPAQVTPSRKPNNSSREAGTPSARETPQARKVSPVPNPTGRSPQAVSEKAQATGKLLKRRAEEKLRPLSGPSSEQGYRALAAKTSVKLGLIEKIECIANFVYSFSYLHEYKSPLSPMLQTSWLSVLGFATEAAKQCQLLGFQHLQAMAMLLEAAARDQLVHVLSKAKKLKPQQDMGQEVFEHVLAGKALATEAGHLMSRTALRRNFPSAYQASFQMPLGESLEPKGIVRVAMALLRDWAGKEGVNWEAQDALRD